MGLELRATDRGRKVIRDGLNTMLSLVSTVVKLN